MTSMPVKAELSLQDRADLQQAISLLEAPSLIQQMSDLIGMPLQQAVRRLPSGTQQQIHRTVIKALESAANAALWSIKDQSAKPPALLGHKIAAAASGFAGGLFGLPGLLVEIPLSTTIMMRSIADIARSQGMSLDQQASRIACLEVFALGGKSNGKISSASDTAYYAARLALAELSQLSTQEMMELSSQASMPAFAAKQASKWLSRLIEAIASRFGVVITEKTAAQIVPIIGAASAATLNTLFTRHYQNMARGHFIVKRLEQAYGNEAIQVAYVQLCRKKIE